MFSSNYHHQGHHHLDLNLHWCQTVGLCFTLLFSLYSTSLSESSPSSTWVSSVLATDTCSSFFWWVGASLLILVLLSSKIWSSIPGSSSHQQIDCCRCNNLTTFCIVILHMKKMTRSDLKRFTCPAGQAPGTFQLSWSTLTRLGQSDGCKFCTLTVTGTHPFRF